MKTLLTKIGLSVLSYILGSEALHNALRDVVKKTDNKYDDAAAEAAIKLLLDVKTLLEK